MCSNVYSDWLCLALLCFSSTLDRWFSWWIVVSSNLACLDLRLWELFGPETSQTTKSNNFMENYLQVSGAWWEFAGFSSLEFLVLVLMLELLDLHLWELFGPGTLQTTKSNRFIKNWLQVYGLDGNLLGFFICVVRLTWRTSRTFPRYKLRVEIQKVRGFSFKFVFLLQFSYFLVFWTAIAFIGNLFENSQVGLYVAVYLYKHL